MKTLKRFFAVAVAVLLIAMLIPAVSAASNNVTWECDFPGYTYTVYKVADYNSTTGAFTASVSSMQTQVDDAVTQTQMAALAESCKTATLPAAGVSFNTDNGSGSFTVDNGIYYVKCTTTAPSNKAITAESIIVFPNKNGTGTTALPEHIDFGGKINEGEPDVDKNFIVGQDRTKEVQSYSTTDKTTADTKTITYVLTADIAGSVDSKLESYVITDKMGTGLNKNKHDVQSVKLVTSGGAPTDLAYDVVTDAAIIDCADTVNGKPGTTGNTFGVSIKASELAKDSFYADGNKVEVTYTTELDYATAVVASQIPNTDALIYGNAAGRNVVGGKTVYATTYEVKALKKDANTHQPITGDGKQAKFGLYADQACSVEIATAFTDTTTGIADFGVKLAEGTYFVKELDPPAGYNLNSEIKSVTLGQSNASAVVEIEDTPAKLPSTGGAGTMVFTIVGGSLVLLAAALFIIVMKKRSAAK